MDLHTLLNGKVPKLVKGYAWKAYRSVKTGAWVRAPPFPQSVKADANSALMVVHDKKFHLVAYVVMLHSKYKCCRAVKGADLQNQSESFVCSNPTTYAIDNQIIKLTP